MKPQVPQWTHRGGGFATTSRESYIGLEEQQLHSGLTRKADGKRRAHLYMAEIDKPVQLYLNNVSVCRYICVGQRRSWEHEDIRDP